MLENEVVVNLNDVKAKVFDYYVEQFENATDNEKMFFAANNMLVAAGVIELIGEAGKAIN